MGKWDRFLEAPSSAKSNLELKGVTIGPTGRPSVSFGQFEPPKRTLEEETEARIKEAVRKEASIRTNKLQELSKIVNFFEKKIDEIPIGSGLRGRLQGIGKGLISPLQLDPKVTAYKSSLDGVKALIARGLGDVGNLSQTEQENAIKLLPNVEDNSETRRQKILNFKDLMREKGLLLSAKPSQKTPSVFKPKGISAPRKISVGGMDFEILGE